MDNTLDNQQTNQQDQNDHRVSIFSRYPERSLFIRDLPFSCTSHDLKRFAAEQTQLPIIRAMVCDNKQQKTLYFGYVLLGSEDQVPIAIERLVGKRFIGRDIKVQAFRSNIVLETANTGVIHVGFRGLKVDIQLITEEVLRAFLESYGELDQIVIRNLLYTKEGNQCGYAFVSFKNMDTNHHVVNSVRQVKIQNIVYQFSWSRHHALQYPTSSSAQEPPLLTSDSANNMDESEENLEKESLNPSSSSTEAVSNSQSQKTASSDESLNQKQKQHNLPHRDKFFHPNNSNSNCSSSSSNHHNNSNVSHNKAHGKGRHPQHHNTNHNDAQMHLQDASMSYVVNNNDNVRNALPGSFFPSNVSANLPPILSLPTPSPPYGYLVSTNTSGQIMNPASVPYGSYPVDGATTISTPTGTMYYVANHSVVNSSHGSPNNGHAANTSNNNLNTSSTSAVSSATNTNNSNNSNSPHIASSSQMKQIAPNAISHIHTHAALPPHMSPAVQSVSSPSSQMFSTPLYPTPTASVQYMVPNSTAAASPVNGNPSYFLTPQYYPAHPPFHHHHHHHPHVGSTFPPRPASPFQLAPAHATANSNSNNASSTNTTNISTPVSNSASNPPVLNVMPMAAVPGYPSYPVSYPPTMQQPQPLHPQQPPPFNQPQSTPIMLQSQPQPLPPPPHMHSHMYMQTHTSVSPPTNGYYTNLNNNNNNTTNNNNVYFNSQISPQMHHTQQPQQQQQQQEQKY